MTIQVNLIVNSRIYFCLGWKSDKSLATQNKKMIYLTEQHGNKGIYSHVSVLICVHPWELYIPTYCTDIH